MNRLKSSYIGKMFFSLLFLYVIVFSLLFIGQGIGFKQAFTRRTISYISDSSNELLAEVTVDNMNEKLVAYSQDTQTTSILTPLQSINDDIDRLSLQSIQVEYLSIDYTILVPSNEIFEYSIGKEVIASLYKNNETQEYIPIDLTVDNQEIIRSRFGSVVPVYQNLIGNIDPQSYIEIEGVISSVSQASDLEKPINPIVSSEILNIATRNFKEYVELSDNSFYYYSYNDAGENTNLVYFESTELNGEKYILISVYPLSHIDDIVSAMQGMNTYIFVIVIFILFITSFFYSKAFSRPLVAINNYTKKLSKLDFETPLIQINTKDEFSELADNINTLSINLKTTIDKLNSQNKTLSDSLSKENQNELKRRDFVRGMSHELKTPLSVIQASAEALEKDIFDTDIERKDTLVNIQNEVQKTNKMIQNMMNVYKLESADYTSEWATFDLSELIVEINKSLELLYKNSNLNVHLDLNKALITADKEKMTLVINNLFTNAIKYTPKGKNINIKLTKRDDFVAFQIFNNTDKLTEEEVSKIFQPFYRVDKARSRSDGSVGLGLYIVQQTLLQLDSECVATKGNNGILFTFKIKSS